ncbi:hypothetical protein SAMN05428967_4441 [Phyllobacterium sp. YR620]|uniref:hypothetical protein n=1 Tax=Phyllobacterium sp. YR620 TaxID=1881066 RepID=UPI00088EF72D|nr:hypothetical protein [Phyllobacterium sp. YR620]SDP92296.1 hypothetical protein SAMN05428967_4441 [Phyllobacterium sp. YR620]
MDDNGKLESGFASFRSDILWMLQPLTDYMRSFGGAMTDNIVVEPCAEGGAIVAGISGHAIAVFRDPHGSCSRPMTLGIPDAMFEACRPPKPIHMTYCGHSYSCPLPEWAQPHTVVAYSAGSFVLPKMRHPDWAEEDDEFHPCLFQATECGRNYTVGQDYKWTAGAPVNWRKPLELALTNSNLTTGVSEINPEVVALFSRIPARIAEVRQRGAETFHRHTQGKDGAPQPVVVTVQDYPDFVGAYMPMSPLPYQPPSLWFQKRVHDARGGVQ